MSKSLARHGKHVICHTDGACLGNGGYGARAGIGVYFGRNHPWNISKPMSSSHRKTNNTAEIRAAIAAIEKAYDHEEYNLKIFSDSQFMVDGITKLIDRWERTGWKTESGDRVMNKTDFLDLDDAIDSMDNVVFTYIPRHENRKADWLARQGAQQDVSGLNL